MCMKMVVTERANKGHAMLGFKKIILELKWDANWAICLWIAKRLSITIIIKLYSEHILLLLPLIETRGSITFNQ